MKEIILSAGIDIGTSTMQLIFSRLTVENKAGSFAIPRIDIVDKEVFYRSDIYITPLFSSTEIDAVQVKNIVAREYQKAGIEPKEVKTGAVIITGEAARKKNATQVLEALSSMAGDFVVATAGPDLESVLAARGAGIDRLSEKKRKVIANLDVGGGTTNIAVYQNGILLGTTCLDIGGRLIKINDGRITYIFHKIQSLAKSCGISIAVGDTLNKTKLQRICEVMASQLTQAIGLEKQDELHRSLYTNNGKHLQLESAIEAVSFSGGVADFINDSTKEECFRFGDIGILLGRAIAIDPAFTHILHYQAAETIRATVVGAGTHTTEVSGSTISYSRERLPVKNIPVLKVEKDCEDSLEAFYSSVRKQMPLYMSALHQEQIAIAFNGKGYTGFSDIQALAKTILTSMKEVMESQYFLIIVVESDIAKALGNALQVLSKNKKDVLCIDGIRALSGDYIDIGEPIAGGHVVPVVIKTLIFNS